MTDLKPRYEVHKLKGTAKRTLDAGWMVYFPSGASIRVWTKEEMERQGFDLPANLIDMETGDETAPMSNVSLKAKSEQKNARSRGSSSRSATT